MRSYPLSGAAILHSFSQTCCSLLNNQNVWSSIGGGKLRFEVDNAPLYSRALNRLCRTLITIATPHTVRRNASLFQLRSTLSATHTLLATSHPVTSAALCQLCLQVSPPLLAMPHPVSYPSSYQLRRTLLATPQHVSYNPPCYLHHKMDIILKTYKNLISSFILTLPVFSANTASNCRVTPVQRKEVKKLF